MAKHFSRNFSSAPDARILGVLQAIEATALLFSFFVGAAILALWFVPVLDRFAPPFWVKTTANTAAAMVCSSASFAVNARHCPPIRRRLGTALGAVVVLVSASVLLEYAGNFSFGLDALLPHAQAGAHPGRPLPKIALAFVLLGVCALTWREVRNFRSRLADLATLLFLALNLLLLGDAFFSLLHHSGLYAPAVISPQTLLALFSLLVVVFLRRAEQGDLLAVVVHLGTGSRMVRLFMPAVLLLPFVLLATEAALADSGVMDVVNAQSLTAALGAVLLVLVLAMMGWRINGLEHDLRDLSLTDELTGVFNRRGFYFLGEQALREAQRAGSGLSVFFFDLDGLKHVNDLMGHEAGSEMIRNFAGILSRTFRKSDIIGRVGGDEFAVITVRDHPMWIESVRHRLVALAEAHNDSGKAYRLSFSAGYVEFDAGETGTLESLVTRADGLMYQDKAKKKLAA